MSKPFFLPGATGAHVADDLPPEAHGVELDPLPGWSRVTITARYAATRERDVQGADRTLADPPPTMVTEAICSLPAPLGAPRTYLERCDDPACDAECAAPCGFCDGTGKATAVDGIKADGALVNPREATCMICDGTGIEPTADDALKPSHGAELFAQAERFAHEQIASGLLGGEYVHAVQCTKPADLLRGKRDLVDEASRLTEREELLRLIDALKLAHSVEISERAADRAAFERALAEREGDVQQARQETINAAAVLRAERDRMGEMARAAQNERDAALDERDRLRPVVEAAKRLSAVLYAGGESMPFAELNALSEAVHCFGASS